MFADLYECHVLDLLSSIDAVNITHPLLNSSSPKYWFHVDQSPDSTDADHGRCVQGLVQLTDVTADQVLIFFICLFLNRVLRNFQATLQVIKGSHVHFEEFFQAHPGLSRQKDYIQPTDQVELIKWFAEKGCTVERIPLLAGQLLLWDSRTFHCGAKPTASVRAPRMCVYVCMQPRQLLGNKKDIERTCARKRAIWGQHRMTSHWPLKNRLFGKTPQLFGRPAPAIKDPPPYGPEDMSALERAIYGF